MKTKGTTDRITTKEAKDSRVTIVSMVTVRAQTSSGIIGRLIKT